MSNLRVDRVTLELAIKSQEAGRRELIDTEKKIGDVSKSVNKLQKQYEQLEKRKPKNEQSKAYQQWKKDIDDVNRELTEERKRLQGLEEKKNKFLNQMGVEKMTLADVRHEMKLYKTILDNLTPDTDEYNKTLAYYQQLQERLRSVNGVVKETQSSLRKFSESFNAVGFAITNALAIKDRIVSWADQYVQAFASMDEAMTDTMKYTGQTKAEVEQMNETFKQMTTRTSREELNALAGAAGRLGIQGRKDIEGFVAAADQINVALGDDLGEGAIDQIGKLTMVFGEDKKKGLEGAMLATGSAVNVLGASSSAATGFITEFTSAMAGMAVNARISQTDIMGYASALSQAGIEGQTASGVFAQMITKMFTDPAKFAKAAGLDVKQFTELLKTDANQAILQFRSGGFAIRPR